MGRPFIFRIFGHSRAKSAESGEGETSPRGDAPTRPEPERGPRYGTQGLWDALQPTAMSVGTVYCCVRLLSESVASLPCREMRRRGGVMTADPDSRLSYLLGVEPDPSVSAFDFWRALVSEVLLSGNAYVVPRYGPGGYTRLALCRRHTVSHDTVADTYTVSDPEGGVYGTFGAGEVIHVKGLPGRDPKRGRSVLSYARMATAIAGSGDRETLSRFDNGGDVRGIVSNGTSVRGFGEYQDEELDRVAESLDDRFRAGERIVSLPGQVSWSQLSMSSADMQFLESRKFTVREICRFFGVHPSFVFDDTSNNYKSAEMANVAFLANTLNPLLRNIENEFGRKLYSPSLSGRRRVEFDRSGLYACDLQTRVGYLSSMIGAGLVTVNEARAMENRPPVERGDTPLVSANLRRIDETAPGTAAEEGKEGDNSNNSNNSNNASTR